MNWTSFLPSFFASTVEFVEALTIVLAIGVSVNWKSSLWGAAAAAGLLVVLVAGFGTTLVLWVPLEVLRLVVGLVLVLFGMQWLRKAVLRYAGLKDLHDEDRIYAKKVASVQARVPVDRHRFDGFGFTTSFKSVLLEGLEVAFIVITFGATSAADKASGLMSAATGALAALFLVVLGGAAVRKPLTRIPENTLKFLVGLLLTTFGTFWAGEGLGVRWPWEDLFLMVLGGFFLTAAGVLVAGLRRRSRGRETGKPAVQEPKAGRAVRWAREVFDFFCGDWWVLGAVVLSSAAAGCGLLGSWSWAVYPVAVALGLVVSLAASA